MIAVTEPLLAGDQKDQLVRRKCDDAPLLLSAKFLVELAPDVDLPEFEHWLAVLHAGASAIAAIARAARATEACASSNPEPAERDRQSVSLRRVARG